MYKEILYIRKSIQNKIIMILLLMVYSLNLYSQVPSSTALFVNKNAASGGNGLSWATAWNSFSAINWNSIQAGDTIYISGGVQSLVYPATLKVQKSGNYGNEVVITKGVDSEHSGRVIIDGENTRPNCIEISNCNYVKILNLEARNPRAHLGKSLVAGGQFSETVLINNSDHIEIDSCVIQHNLATGIKLEYSDNCKITYNNIYTEAGHDTLAETDGIYIQFSVDNIEIAYNTIISRNERDGTSSACHKDLIQISGASPYNSNGSIHHNFAINDVNTNPTQTAGIFLRGLKGNWIVYNNIIVNRGGSYNAVLSLGSETIGNFKARIYNNILVAQNGQNYPVAIYRADSAYIYNNLIYKPEGIRAIEINEGISGSNTYLECDYNRYFLSSTTSSQARISSTHYTWAQWQALGFEANGSTGAFSFANLWGTSPSDYKTAGDWKGIDLGTTISTFDTDFEDKSRPLGGSWDIGAYEYFSESNIDLTQPQLVTAQILDSITVLIEFSEAMNETSVENPNSFSISDGINVFNSEMITSTKVQLSTSSHSNQTYQIVVSNVTDTAGNVISPQHNSKFYEYQSGSTNDFILLPVNTVLASVTPEPNHHAQKTLDGKGYYHGDPDSRWAGDTMPEWLVYDLGDVQVLNQTKLSFFNWHAGRVYNYSLQVSSDSIIWNDVKTNIQSLAAEWSIENIGPIEARYIKIIFIANNQSAWAGLWEAEFYGHPQTPAGYEDEKIVPLEYSLEQNYPNPFNPSTKIKVQLPQHTQIRLVVYNLLGEIVKEVANGEYEAGLHEFSFDAIGLASGVYVYRIESPDFINTKKMVLLR